MKKENYIYIAIALFVAIVLIGVGFGRLVSNERSIRNEEPNYTSFSYVLEGEQSDDSDERLATPEREETTGTVVKTTKGYKDLKKDAPKNLLSSINGIPVSRYGTFEINLNNTHFKVYCITIECSDCGTTQLNFSSDAFCGGCGKKLDYSMITKKVGAFQYGCPICDNHISDYRAFKFCPTCGTNQEKYWELLRNFKWESR